MTKRGWPEIPMGYVDSMPCDSELLVELGRVTWAAARLHYGVRDEINRNDAKPSDAPFGDSLGQVLTALEQRAAKSGSQDQTDWVQQVGRPAKVLRDGVAHAVTFTTKDGKPAIGAVRGKGSEQFSLDDLREVTRRLIQASMTLPHTVEPRQGAW